VLFENLTDFKTVHFGNFWELIKKDFPNVDDAAPIPPVVEDSPSPFADMELLSVPPLRRALFRNEDRSSLIQIQPDRFVFNWKREAGSADYPSFVDVNAKFNEYLSGYSAFLKDHEICNESLTYRQFELTYVNRIDNSNGLDIYGYDKVLIDHSINPQNDRFLPKPEMINWVSSYALPEGQGRLHISGQVPGNLPESDKFLQLTLTARGISKDISEEGRKGWFELAHYWITHAFTDITVSEIQKDFWGRTL